MFDPTAYDIEIYNNGDGSSGTGTVTLKNVELKIGWNASGGHMEVTIGDICYRAGSSDESERVVDGFSEFTEPFDVVTAQLEREQYTGSSFTPEDWSARVKNGKILWLIVENEVQIGTILPVEGE